MELDERLDDEEQQLVEIENNNEEDPIGTADPLGPEMVEVTSETAPAQGSTTPRSTATPDPPNEPTEAAPETSPSLIPTIEAMRASLDQVLADAQNMWSAPPDVSVTKAESPSI